MRPCKSTSSQRIKGSLEENSLRSERRHWQRLQKKAISNHRSSSSCSSNPKTILKINLCSRPIFKIIWQAKVKMKRKIMTTKRLKEHQECYIKDHLNVLLRMRNNNLDSLSVHTRTRKLRDRMNHITSPRQFLHKIWQPKSRIILQICNLSQLITKWI